MTERVDLSKAASAIRLPNGADAEVRPACKNGQLLALPAYSDKLLSKPDPTKAGSQTPDEPTLRPMP